MDAITGAQARELMPCDTFEWQRILRRLQIPSTAKLIGLMMSTYANANGTNVMPGVDRLVLVSCTSKATVKRQLDLLRDLGLIERVKQGNRHAKMADEYRLTMPSNVLDLPMLDPEEKAVSGAHE